MRTLYEITHDVAAINLALEEAEGDLSKLPTAELGLLRFFEEDNVARQLDDLAEERARKLDSYVNLIRELRMQETRARAEVDQWLAKRSSLGERADYLEKRLKEHLLQTGERRAETASGRTIAICGNGGLRPVEYSEAIDLRDEELKAYVKWTPELDREKVREALENGVALSFASLKDRGNHLRVT